MKTHLTDYDILDMAYEKLHVRGRLNPDKIVEMAELMDLEYDEEKDAYYNPDCCNCAKVLNKLDLKFGKKSPPYLCVTCFTGNA